MTSMKVIGLALGRCLLTVFLASMLASCVQAPAPVVPHSLSMEDAHRCCQVSSGAPERMMLADGSRLLIDPSSMVARGDSVLMLGSQLIVLGGPGEVAADGAIGVLRDPSGALSVVPSPRPHGTVHEPKAVPAEGGGWDVLFVTSETASQFGYFDSAGIWYAHFDGRTWDRVERVADAISARLAGPGTGNPVVSDNGLVFPYIFDRSRELRSNAEGNQGVVMLRQRNGGWAADTLPTWEAPGSIRLSRMNGELRAIMTKSYFADQRPHGPALFTANYDDGWRTPRMVFDPSGEYVADVVGQAGSEGADGLSWRVDSPDADGFRIEWGVVEGDSLSRRYPVATGPFFGSRPTTVQWDDRRTVLLIRDGESQDRLDVYVASKDGVVNAGTVTIPLMNLITHSVPLADGRILVLTGGQDSTDGADPPFVSYLTELTVNCATPAAEEARIP
jgi:hypothetical protein